MIGRPKSELELRVLYIWFLKMCWILRIPNIFCSWTGPTTEYWIPQFDPNYSNIWMVRIIRDNTPLYSSLEGNSAPQSPHAVAASLLAWASCLHWDLCRRKVSIDLQFLFLQTGQENCLDLPVSFWTSSVSILLWKSWYISTSLEEIKLLSYHLNYFTR